MRSVEGVFGKIVAFLMCSYVSFTLLVYVDVKQFVDRIPLTVPFKSLAVFGGFFVVLWVAMAREICGKGFGTLTAVLSASLCLLVSPWFGIVRPEWFSVFGILSFLLLGIGTDYFNGGIGNLSCMLVNWIGAYLFDVAKITPLGVMAMGTIAFVSGYMGDVLAHLILSKSSFGGKFLAP